MGFFSSSKADEILEVRERYDRGEASAKDVLAVVRKSTGNEINEAMDRYGEGTESWSRIR